MRLIFIAAFNQFDQLTSLQAEELLSRLIGVICRRVEKTVSQAMKMAEYDATNDKYVFAEYYGHPYPLLARSCMGHVETWAAKHSIPVSEILFFFENGAKHRGQLEWIAERDRLPVPIFLDKSQATPLQAGDLMAWCYNLHLTSNGKIPPIYDRGLNKLLKVSNDWGLIRMPDPHRIPALLDIPKRDSDMQYQYRIVKHKGKRFAVTQSWTKGQIAPKVVKHTLQLPEQPALTLEALIKASEKYARKKSATIKP